MYEYYATSTVGILGHTYQAGERITDEEHIGEIINNPDKQRNISRVPVDSPT